MLDRSMNKNCEHVKIIGSSTKEVKEDISCLLQGKSSSKIIWYIMFLHYSKGFTNKDHQVGYQATPIDLIKEFGRGETK
jgi:hypothetical protein